MNITKGDVFINNKTKELYTILHMAEDCTNERWGIKVVVYTPKNKPEVYTRDLEEFKEKFTFVMRIDE